MTTNLIDNYVRYRNDPWAFISECVYTLDQVDKVNPIKKFPEREYLKLVSKLWVKYPLIAVPKSRRMTMSWLTISLYLWDTIFHKGRFNAFVSKKEDDANELVNKAKFILEHLDKDNFPKDFIPKYAHKFCVLDFPEIQSKIQGFPQGADQLRQFTFSGIFGDECAFWEQAKQFYAASFPTIDGGGRMSLISSPAPGFFKQLCFDRIDIDGNFDVPEVIENVKYPIDGVKTWINSKNKFLVVELHYSADPKKNNSSYTESIKNSMPTQEYLREYELQWDTFAGMPVYPEFSRKLHVTTKKPSLAPGLPLLIGLDFGLTPACVIGQLQEGTLYIFEELVEFNMGMERFSDMLIAHIRTNYPTKSNLAKDILLYIDPSGHFRKDTDESTCAQILGTKGFTTFPGPIAWEARRKAVVTLLMKLTKDGPALQIYGPACSTLIKGFEGGYQFSDKVAELEPNKLRPLKNEYSHVHDGMQYLASGIANILSKISKPIPRPEYKNVGDNNSMYRRITTI